MNVTGILLTAWVIVCLFMIGSMAKKITRKYK